MKKIYRKLFELFSWLGWVTGYEKFYSWAGRFYIHSAKVIGRNFQPVSQDEEKETKKKILQLLGEAHERADL